MAHTVGAITERAASEAGALDGYGATCTCGLELQSSLLHALEHDIRDHTTWHRETGR